jgi:hypothetical protein
VNANTITEAIAELDDELARLTSARQLLVDALDILCPVELPSVTITQHVAKPELLAATIADLATGGKVSPKTRKPGAGRKPKHDWQAIGEVARLAAGAGQPVAAALAAEFNVNSTTAYWMVKRCRELGYLGESQRFTSEPITRTEVNEQSARERAAAAL